MTDEERKEAERLSKTHLFNGHARLSDAFVAGFGAACAMKATRMRAADDLAEVIEHALELGHLGEGSTEAWAKDALKTYRRFK